jgi:hypothetical protein
MTDLSNWTQRDEGMWLNGYKDVSVTLNDTMTGRAFRGRVGSAEGDFRHLLEALDWCESTTLGRAILTTAEPPQSLLPVESSDQQFLAERGLSA